MGYSSGGHEGTYLTVNDEQKSEHFVQQSASLRITGLLLVGPVRDINAPFALQKVAARLDWAFHSQRSISGQARKVHGEESG